MMHASIFYCSLGAMLLLAAGAGELELTATDGGKVFALLTPVEEGQRADGVVLLFHQARSNRHEYDPMLPIFTREARLDALSVDQRSGGSMWGCDNRTVIARGSSAKYLDALPDLQAALDWAQAQGYRKVIAVGSSYSAALCFLLARDNPGKLAALACFSPGEYLGVPGLVATAATKSDIPVYVTCAADPKEVGQVDALLRGRGDRNVSRYRARTGVHGASTLRDDSNHGGGSANRSALLDFLSRVPLPPATGN